MNRAILEEIAAERERQDQKWGVQDHPSFDVSLTTRPGGSTAQRMTENYEIPSEHRAKFLCDTAFKNGEGTFAHILVEEVSEAVSARNKRTLRLELIQVAAVAAAWVEALDRRDHQ